MRNLLLSTLLLVSACGDNGGSRDGDAEADAAGAEGEQLGQQQAQQTNAELGGDEASAILAQSGSIMLTIDEGEIMQAQYALQVADDDEVVAYANRMVVEHTAHAARTGMLMSGLELAPQDNPISMMLRAEAMAGLAELQAHADREDHVDFEYMRMQVKMHAQAYFIVGALVTLAPADDPKQFFAETQATIAGHRADAESVLRDL